LTCNSLIKKRKKVGKTKNKIGYAKKKEKEKQELENGKKW